MEKRSLSGIRCSGVIHIGNYLGVIREWVSKQDEYENIYFLADLHAITTTFEPERLKNNIYDTLALYLACGLNPKKSIIFLQSQMPEHTQLAWILNTIAHLGELKRMTQFKEKSKGKREKVGLGLFNYPILMAADILLYQVDIVPVGEDQVQHVELTRDLARRFNYRFGQTFKIPRAVVQKKTARIMALDEPGRKMDKSAESEYNYIALVDSPEAIRRKIAKATTDSQKDILFDPKREGLYNLLTIYQAFSRLEQKIIEKKFAGKGYVALKKDLAELIIKKLAPIQKKYHQFIKDKRYLDKVLSDGAKKAQPIAQKTLKLVKEKIGLI